MNYNVYEMVILHTPTRYGYFFEGWYLNNIKVTVVEKETTNNIYLEAR